MQQEEVKMEAGPSSVPVIRAGMFGQIEPFVPGEDWEEYVNRLEMFFLVNDTPEAKKVPVLFTVGGSSLFTIAKRLCAPDSPRTKSYADITKLLQDHLAPTTNIVAERYNFRRCEQSASQSIADFIIILKAKSQECKFEAFLSDALRDQFVAGIRDQGLRKRLLTEPDLTFDKACTLARSWEAAINQNKEMSSQSVSSIAAMQAKSGKKQQKNKPREQLTEKNKPHHPQQKCSKPCFRCGRQHDPVNCPARNWTCYSCGKSGHVSTVCQKASRQSSKSGGSKRVGEISEAEEVLRLNLLAWNKEEKPEFRSPVVVSSKDQSVPESSCRVIEASSEVYVIESLSQVPVNESSPEVQSECLSILEQCNSSSPSLSLGDHRSVESSGFAGVRVPRLRRSPSGFRS